MVVSSADSVDVGGGHYGPRMDVVISFVQVFGPGIIATAIAGVVVWALRGVLQRVLRGVLWMLRAIGAATLRAIKWRIGWY
jgi:hypothetical protein